jgi:hypothetical protein
MTKTRILAACAAAFAMFSVPSPAWAEETLHIVCSNTYGQAEQVTVDYDAQTATVVDGATKDGSVEVQAAPAQITDRDIRFKAAGMAADAPTTYTLDLGAKTLTIRQWSIERDGPQWSTDTLKCADWTTTGETS